jgi:hypothetical protein
MFLPCSMFYSLFICCLLTRIFSKRIEPEAKASVAHNGFILSNDHSKADSKTFIEFDTSTPNNSCRLEPQCIPSSSISCINVFLSNTVYRVSDIVKHNGLKWQNDSYHILNNATFRSSLLYYMLNCTGKIVNNRYKFGSVEANKWILARELKHLAPFCPFPDDTLLYYMRLGNVSRKIYNSNVFF